MLPDTDNGSIFHFPQHCGIGNFRRFTSILIVSGQFSRQSDMTDADNIMNPQHFGSDPPDIRIRIPINPEIRIRILDYFRLRLDALAEVCTL